jgi:hypothetical protein
MALVLNGDGNLTGLTAGGLPDASITQADLATGVAGTGPAFSANTPTTKSAANATATEMAGYSAPNFDTASCFNTTTGRFTPNVAGYYQFSWSVDFGSNGVGAASVVSASLYKNATAQWTGGIMTASICFSAVGSSAPIYMNGSTDFASVYLFQTSGGTTSNFFARFAGAMIRGA